jgi:hypothetical protein
MDLIHKSPKNNQLINGLIFKEYISFLISNHSSFVNKRKIVINARSTIKNKNSENQKI